MKFKPFDVKKYDFIGESAYVAAVDDIREYLSFLDDSDYAYDMAISEAVLNAAQNSVDGLSAAKIHIDIRHTQYDIITKVSCKTKPFDMMAYREQLRGIASRPEYANADWTDYTGNADTSRGIWYMLLGTEYLYMDCYAQSICLCNRNPCIKGRETKKMRDLLMRFFVEKDGA